MAATKAEKKTLEAYKERKIDLDGRWRCQWSNLRYCRRRCKWPTSPSDVPPLPNSLPLKSVVSPSEWKIFNHEKFQGFMLHTLLLSRPNSEGSIVTESILISLEMCSANSPGWRTREAEFVTLAKVLAACSQMATMDMVAVCQFGYFMQFTVTSHFM